MFVDTSLENKKASHLLPEEIALAFPIECAYDNTSLSVSQYPFTLSLYYFYMKYVALLRGIGPGNPNMHNDKLRSVFENLGFTEVKSVISSGNIIFETDRTDAKAMETELEAAWPEQLGFKSTTIIRSEREFADIIAAHPFQNLVHGPKTYLFVTFLKQPTGITFDLPYHPEGKNFTLLAADEDTLFTVVDTTTGKTPDVMVWLEKTYGKEISSRTFKTVQRIMAKVQAT